MTPYHQLVPVRAIAKAITERRFCWLDISLTGFLAGLTLGALIS